MAKKTPIENDFGERTSPLLPNALLWVGFLVVLAIGVVTVFLPEMADDGTDEEGGAALIEGEGVEGEDAEEAAEPAPAPAPAP
jgi:hypothetical protein